MFAYMKKLNCYILQGDHSPDNVKFPDNSLVARGIPAHVKKVLLISCWY